MSATVTTIQTKVRELDREDALDLMVAGNMALLNVCYLTLGMLARHVELRRTTAFSSTTTKGTAAYAWPTTPAYVDVTLVEIQDHEDGLKYKPVLPARSEWNFNRLRREPDDLPREYMREHNGTVNQAILAPAPAYTGLTVRATGYIEPTKLAIASDATIFQSESLDEALAYMFSGNHMIVKGDPGYAESMLRVAAQILSRIVGREVEPGELTMRGVDNGT